jgi:hypothetical protein
MQAMQLSTSFTGTRFRTSVCAPEQPKATPRQVTCMAKKKGTRIIVTLECTEARGEGGTPSRYTTQKVGRRRLRHAAEPRGGLT